MPDIAASSADARSITTGSNAALISACHAGDPAAFLTLVRHHHPALRALARCWPGSPHDAERAVAHAWLAVLGSSPPAPRPLRARAARAVVAACVERTGVACEPAPPSWLDTTRFFPTDHDLWAREWADPPRPWGAIAERRLAMRDIPRALGRTVRELGIGPTAALTLCDVHGWPVAECAFALARSESQARALLRAAREGVRAALEAEIDSR
jgi:DNA-directed RNA polymerase specialized sigma24 family protein